MLFQLLKNTLIAASFCLASTVFASGFVTYQSQLTNQDWCDSAKMGSVHCYTKFNKPVVFPADVAIIAPSKPVSLMLDEDTKDLQLTGFESSEPMKSTYECNFVGTCTALFSSESSVGKLKLVFHKLFGYVFVSSISGSADDGHSFSMDFHARWLFRKQS